MLLSICLVCNRKIWKFLKEQETRGLSILGIRTPISHVPLLGPLKCKMNELINKFLLARDRFLPEIYLRKPGFI